jgi:hypothetical protein
MKWLSSKWVERALHEDIKDKDLEKLGKTG